MKQIEGISSYPYKKRREREKKRSKKKPTLLRSSENPLSCCANTVGPHSPPARSPGNASCCRHCLGPAERRWPCADVCAAPKGKPRCSGRERLPGGAVGSPAAGGGGGGARAGPCREGCGRSASPPAGGGARSRRPGRGAAGAGPSSRPRSLPPPPALVTAPPPMSGPLPR